MPANWIAALTSTVRTFSEALSLQHGTVLQIYLSSGPQLTELQKTQPRIEWKYPRPI